MAPISSGDVHHTLAIADILAALSQSRSTRWGAVPQPLTMAFVCASPAALLARPAAARRNTRAARQAQPVRHATRMEFTLAPPPYALVSAPAPTRTHRHHPSNPPCPRQALTANPTLN
jgi:hypothetical protein